MTKYEQEQFIKQTESIKKDRPMIVPRIRESKYQPGLPPIKVKRTKGDSK